MDRIRKAKAKQDAARRFLRKSSQPKKNIVPDPKFNSTIIPKLINNIMYDGKRGVAAKIVYDAIEKIKTKSNFDANSLL